MDDKQRSALQRPPIQLEDGKRPPAPVASDLSEEQVTNLLRLWQMLGTPPPTPPKEADHGL